MIIILPCLAEGSKSIQLTNFDHSELTNNSGMITLADLAWKPYRYLIKDGMFITKDIAILKAKLTMFDYYFMPDPHKNRYTDELIFLESQIEAAKVDLHSEIERSKKARKVLAFTIPGSIVLFTVVGFVGGFRLRSRLD